MRISRMAENALSETLEICIEHNGEQVIWPTDIFDKASIRKGFEPNTVFEHLNEYWSYIPKQTQDFIFNTYKDIKNDFDNIFTRAELTTVIVPKIATLLDAHDFQHARRWVEIESDIIIPSSLKSEYIDNRDRSGTREQTYLRGEYIDLATMAVIIRAMIPIWGEFIYRNKRHVNNTYKELYAYELIVRSKLNNSTVMDRLLNYIECNFPKDKSLISHVVGGLSAQDVPYWMLGLVLVRRLTMGDLKNPNPSHTLVSYIFKFIFHRLQSSDGNFAGEIKKKEFETQKDDGGISVLESFKMKQEVPTGQLVIIDSSMRNTDRIVNILGMSDWERINKAIETTHELHVREITDTQIQLLQWVLKPVISPRGVLHLNKVTLVSAIAIAQEYLYSHGFYFLACFLSSHAMSRNDELIMSGSDTRTRIPKDLIEGLSKYYPYDQRPKQKSTTVKRNNSIIDVIESLASSISDRIWISTMSVEDTEKALNRSYSKRLIIPQDIKVKVAELVLHIAKRSESQYLRALQSI